MVLAMRARPLPLAAPPLPPLPPPLPPRLAGGAAGLRAGAARFLARASSSSSSSSPPSSSSSSSSSSAISGSLARFLPAAAAGLALAGAPSPSDMLRVTRRGVSTTSTIRFLLRSGLGLGARGSSLQNLGGESSSCPSGSVTHPPPSSSGTILP
ncbi:hypothetical protein DFH27DRAFT_550236 [Peziza echinospora]|nr:hypothetical protein DFH27DRAFT_550236 [Peziza echinospora]